jgi:hypothetical protein
MKAVCAALGVARSNVHLQAMRANDWIDGRTARVRDPDADLMLTDAVRAEIISLPTYGYRRAGALVNRTRILMSMLPVNHVRHTPFTSINLAAVQSGFRLPAGLHPRLPKCHPCKSAAHIRQPAWRQQPFQ